MQLTKHKYDSVLIRKKFRKIPRYVCCESGKANINKQYRKYACGNCKFGRIGSRIYNRIVAINDIKFIDKKELIDYSYDDFPDCHYERLEYFFI